MDHTMPQEFEATQKFPLEKMREGLKEYYSIYQYNHHDLHIPRYLMDLLGHNLAFRFCEYHRGTRQLRKKDLEKLVYSGVGILISLYSPTEAVKFLTKKTFQSLPICCTTLDECLWCKTKTFYLHEHHFPIPKSMGGKETVKICPNCHSEYHALVDYKIFKIKHEIIEILDLHKELNLNQ